MRAVSAPAAAVLSSGFVPLVLLIEMGLTSPLNLNTSNATLVVDGITYYGTKGLGRVAPMHDTSGDVSGLTFELSGVPSAMIASVLGENVQGKSVSVKLCVLDPGTYAVLDTRLRWAGMLDVMSISEAQGDEGGTATISVSAEHAGIDLSRPASSYYADEDQQRLSAGDLFFQFQNDQVDQRIVWPAAEWFRK